MARLTRAGIVLLVLIALAAVGWHFARQHIAAHPQDVPWTPLRLDDPIGAFSLRKIASLGDSPAQCLRLLSEAETRHVAAPPRQSGADCGYSDGMRIVPSEDEPALAPAGLVTSCPVAAAMTVWERQVLQQAAIRHLGSKVTAINHAGSYSCRRLYGRDEGRFSEHATADAIDIIGFDLADGRRVSVLADWRSTGPKATFLHDVRDGACRLFATVLSPDYNAAHADHLHFDQASRGRMGIGVCQ